MSQLNKWMLGGKISKLVVVITDKETSENVERWQFDVSAIGLLEKNHHAKCFQVQLFGKPNKKSSSRKEGDKENAAPG